MHVARPLIWTKAEADGRAEQDGRAPEEQEEADVDDRQRHWRTSTLRGQLEALLARLDSMEASGGSLDAAESALLRSVATRLGPGSLPEQNKQPPLQQKQKQQQQQQQQKQQTAASSMRYSTPNLLLTSNFEHILRQRSELVSGNGELAIALLRAAAAARGGASRASLQCTRNNNNN